MVPKSLLDALQVELLRRDLAPEFTIWLSGTKYIANCKLDRIPMIGND
jgi:hypothetical protein